MKWVPDQNAAIAAGKEAYIYDVYEGAVLGRVYHDAASSDERRYIWKAEIFGKKIAGGRTKSKIMAFEKAEEALAEFAARTHRELEEKRNAKR